MEKKTETTSEWESKTMFVSNMTGDEIVEQQDMINTADKMFVTATQVFPVMVNGTHNTKDGKRIYDCFIYYKVKKSSIAFFDKDNKRQKKEIIIDPKLKSLMEEIGTPKQMEGK